jgi:ESCRT-II complex subunit VPS22
MIGGFAEINRRQEEEATLALARERINATVDKAAKNQMEKFKSTLERFAIEHKTQLKEDPDFRSAFNKMCFEIGVDPLQSTKGFWSSILGVGDFYHELSIKVIEVCMKQKRSNGGLLELSEVLEQVRRTYKGKNPPKIGEGDIAAALKNLGCLGSGYSIVDIGKKKYMKTTSFDLDADHNAILSLAEGKGYFTDKGSLSISDKRFKDGVESLLQQGFIWLDEYKGVKTYYVCAMFKGFNE